MTGMEIPAAAAAAQAGRAAGKALSGSDAEKAMLREIAKDSPGALAAGAAMGARMAAKQKAINRLLTPLFYFAGYREEYFASGAFAEELAERMRDVPEERLVSPQPNVAAQAMEGLSYSLDAGDLKEMYLNLLAAASDADRSDVAHPSYASVIRQLSAEEAKLIPLVLGSKAGIPAAEIRLVAKPGGGAEGFYTHARHVMDLTDAITGAVRAVPQWALYVDNWVRLGLVVADYTRHRVGEEAYAYVERRPEYMSGVIDARFEMGFEKGLIMTTDFGYSFGQAVLPATEAAPGAA